MIIQNINIDKIYSITESNTPFHFKSLEEAQKEGIEFYKKNTNWNIQKLNILLRLMTWLYETPDKMIGMPESGLIDYNEGQYQLFYKNEWYDVLGITPENAAENIIKNYLLNR